MKPESQKIDALLFLMVSALMLLGSVMVYSSSAVIADAGEKYSSHAFFLKRQLLWLGVAYMLMLVISRLNLDRLRPLAVPGLLVCLLLLVAVFIRPEIRGTHRWFSLGPLTFQPAELFKYVLIFYLAHSLSQKGRDLKSARLYLWPYGPLILTGALLIVLEPDLGMVLVMMAAVIVLFYLAGARIWHMSVALGGAALAVYFLIFILGYKKGRVDSYLTSLADMMLADHQVRQSLLSLACGGLFGVGLGNGIFKQFFLPEPHTDFIFASIGEELGLIGLVVTLALLFGLVWRGFKIAAAQPDRFRFLLAMGVTACLAIGMIINIAVVLGLVPTTGLTLPFLSYGGSSLAVSAAAVGLLLNLSRRKARSLP